jgi:hypothetical protein
MEQITGSVSPTAFQHIPERVEPFLGFGGVGVDHRRAICLYGLAARRTTRLSDRHLAMHSSWQRAIAARFRADRPDT